MVGDEGAGDRDLAWLLDDLASRVKDFKRAVILSRDGLLLAASRDLSREEAEHLSAVAAALQVVVVGVAARHGDDHRDHVEHLAVGGLGAAAGHGVRADHRAGVADPARRGHDGHGRPAHRVAVGGHHAHSFVGTLEANRECEIRCGLARLTSIAIS